MATETHSRATLPIRWRLTIGIAVAFSVSLLAIFISIYFAVNQILEDDVEGELASSFEQIRGLTLVRGADEDVLQVTADGYPFPVVFYDGGGSLIYANPEADARAMRLTEGELIRVTVEGERIDESIEIGGENYRIRSGSQLTDGRVLIIQVGQSTQAAKEIREVLTAILLIGGGGAALVVAIAGFYLARNALRPVERITRLAADIEASDLKRRIAVKKQPKEIQRLADTFDAMLGRLATAFSQQRDFVMDVSHELRTPLTGLRGNLDVLLMDPKLDAETRLQLERMSEEVSRLIRLTSNLLYLAHVDAGRDIARHPVDLNDLLLEVVYQSRNIRMDVNLRLDLEEQATVSGDRDLLKQLVLNLVDNAIKYSPPGGDVVISLRHSEGKAQLVVEDQGEGIPSDQLELIFERFYRVTDRASRAVSGAGIGLAIGRWIARAHGGDLRAESAEGQGARFVAILPLATEVTRVPVDAPR